MLHSFDAHDLLWLDSMSAIEGANPAWESGLWHPGLPVVVRRDSDADGRIPIGIRGACRHQRLAGWVRQQHVVRRVTPEALSIPAILQHTPFREHPVIQAAIHLCRMSWTWQWGITGSAAYALATGEAVLSAGSDLDVLIRLPKRPDPKELLRWQNTASHFSCRMDTQVEGPLGAFSLSEWERGGPVLLKTKHGPYLINDPFQDEVQDENTFYLSRTGGAAPRHAAVASTEKHGPG